MEDSTLKIIKTVLIVLAVIAAVAGIAYAVYKYFFADKDEDEFLDDIDDAFLDFDGDDEEDPFDDMVVEN